ncbi:MAG: 50S ribosomal protein L29 [Candidatus Saccharimonadales bacterium]|jgi:ribosomal protein L29
MAEKTTKKAAPKKAELSLSEQLAAKRADMMEAQKSHAAGELVNPRVLGSLRKEIARLLTTINAKEGK